MSKDIEKKSEKNIEIDGNLILLQKKQSELEKRVEEIQVTLDEKVSLLGEIEKYKTIISVLQQEMKEFSAQFIVTKENAEKGLSALKEQLNSLYTGIGNVISQIK